MSVFEIILVGVALAMDAVAVSMTNGMSDPKMPVYKAVGMAGAFGLFQFFMPLVGYCCGEAFAYYVGLIAPTLSFVLLAFIGGKMIYDCIAEMKERDLLVKRREKRSGSVKLLAQAFATSMDALAVGITLLAVERDGTLACPFLLCACIIGAVTFFLSFAAVAFGKRAGALIADRAGILGGVILLFIGTKILVESFLP